MFVALTQEQEQDPYYVDLERVRSDIVIGQVGVPLELTITVVDAGTGSPVAEAAVDIWQCDPMGEYSEGSAEHTLGKGYLRGVQLTDANGRARFTTLYPGQSAGRAPHINAKVHIAGRVIGDTYAAGHVSHTGQMFFSDDISTEVFKLWPYRHETPPRVLDEADRVYSEQGGAESTIELTRAGGSLSEGGFKGAITLAVNPESTPEVFGAGAAGAAGAAGGSPAG
jgi:protocatechuate 3,4-dioxygenase beta subunit